MGDVRLRTGIATLHILSAHPLCTSFIISKKKRTNAHYLATAVNLSNVNHSFQQQRQHRNNTQAISNPPAYPCDMSGSLTASSLLTSCLRPTKVNQASVLVFPVPDMWRYSAGRQLLPAELSVGCRWRSHTPCISQTFRMFFGGSGSDDRNIDEETNMHFLREVGMPSAIYCTPQSIEIKISHFKLTGRFHPPTGHHSTGQSSRH